MNALIKYFLLLLFCTFSINLFADPKGPQLTPVQEIEGKLAPKRLLPKLHSDSYILIDAGTKKILVEKNSTVRKAPVSLTKMMVMYVVSDFLHKGQIHLDDRVYVSKEAWKTGGSRSFIKEGQYITIESLIKGIIIQSGNDASVALAEHISGDVTSFVKLMNDQAQALGMHDSNFTDPIGLPDPNQYSTAKDLAILSAALVNDFPKYYHWYKEKSFTLNGIAQHNRNRLLWRMPLVDGIKTGHADKPGFSLSASAKKDDMRIIAVILGNPSDETRTLDGKRLLNYGFNFFETRTLFTKQQKIAEIPVWFGQNKKIAIGVLNDLMITIPKKDNRALSAKLQFSKSIKAPLNKGDIVGSINVTRDNKTIETHNLVALEDNPKGSLFKRTIDSFKYSATQMYNKIFA